MDDLQILGLTDTQTVLYRRMLNLPLTTADELAQDQPATGDEAFGPLLADLNRLVELQLVLRIAGEPARYTAEDPKVALIAAISRQEDALLRARRTATQFGREFHESFVSRDHSQIIEIIDGGDQILARLNQATLSARAEIRVLDKPPYHHPDDPNEPELAFLARGGHARVVYETSALAIDERKGFLHTWMTAGENARTAPHLPCKVIIFDDDSAIMPLRTASQDTPSPSFVMIRRSSLLEALIALFETVWSTAHDLNVDNEPARDTEGAILTSQDRAILALMDAGINDEIISRHLQLSYRTLQRRIQNLMRQYGASTRFQLGARTCMLTIVNTD